MTSLLQTQAPAMLEVLKHIDQRVEQGQIPCPECGTIDRNFGEIRHHVGCPFATLLNQLGE